MVFPEINNDDDVILLELLELLKIAFPDIKRDVIVISFWNVEIFDTYKFEFILRLLLIILLLTIKEFTETLPCNNVVPDIDRLFDINFWIVVDPDILIFDNIVTLPFTILLSHNKLELIVKLLLIVP